MFLLRMIVGVVLGYLRLTGEKSEQFQALAHVFMGFLLGVCIYVKNPYKYWVLFVVMCAVELYSFIYLKG